MNKLDGIAHDDGHSENVVSHLFEFYRWVLKNHPELYQEFLKEAEKT